MVVQKILCALIVALFMSNVSTLQAAQVVFTPAVTLSEEYSDNLFLSSQNEIDDFITSAGLELTGQMLWRTAGIKLNYSPTYKSFDENDALNYWRHQAGLFMWKELGRNTKFTLTDNYLRTDNPTDESAAISQNDQAQGPAIEADRNRRGRNEYYANIAQASLAHQFGANDRVSVAYQYSILRDVDTLPGIPVNDNDIATPMVALAYNISPGWSAEINGSYEITDYEEQNDRNEFNGSLRLLYRIDRNMFGYFDYRHTILNFDQDTDEDYRIYEPSIGFRYAFERHAKIEIGCGYYIQDFDTSDNQEGYNVTSNIAKKWTYRTGYFDMAGDSGYIIDDNGSQNNGLDIYYQGRLEVGRHLTSRLTGLVYGKYRYDSYPDETPERVDRTTTAGLGFDWQALQWMVIRLSYSFSNVSSDREVNEYTENRAMLTVKMAPSIPYRWN